MLGRDDRGLERQLSKRHAARTEFVEALSGRLSAADRRRRLRPRFAYAGALTVAMLVALAAFGGMGYASSTLLRGIDTPANVVKHVVLRPKVSRTTTANVVRNQTPASDQYKPGCGFGDKNHTHTGPPGRHNGFPGTCPSSAGGGTAKCNSGRGNGSETPARGTNVNGRPNDCDPGNSGPVNHGGD
jgi:hypothetical protein